MSKTFQIVLRSADVRYLPQVEFINRTEDGYIRVRITAEKPGFTPPQQFKPCSQCDRPALCQTILAGAQPCVHPDGNGRL